MLSHKHLSNSHTLQRIKLTQCYTRRHGFILFYISKLELKVQTFEFVLVALFGQDTHHTPTKLGSRRRRAFYACKGQTSRFFFIITGNICLKFAIDLIPRKSCHEGRYLTYRSHINIFASIISRRGGYNLVSG